MPLQLPQLPIDVRSPQAVNARTLDPAVVVGATRLAAMFDKSRHWAQRLMREWWREQEQGGPVRVFKRNEAKHHRSGRAVRSFRYYTTIAIVDTHMARRPDRALERRLRQLESDVSEAYARIAELERAMGKRR